MLHFLKTWLSVVYVSIVYVIENVHANIFFFFILLYNKGNKYDDTDIK